MKLSPTVIAPKLGAVGIVYGVPTTAAETALSPTAFRAVTEQEYSRPLVRPGTVMGDATALFEGLSNNPPRQVAVNCVIGEPPSVEGGVKLTTRARSADVTCVTVGEPGAVGAGASPPPPPQELSNRIEKARIERSQIMAQRII